MIYNWTRRMVVTVLCLVSMLSISQAQRGYEFGPSIGVSNYFGDLNTIPRILDFGPSASFGLRYNFGYRICLKASLNYGFVYADDKNNTNNFQKARNLNFKSHIGDFTSTVEFNFLPYVHGSMMDNFTPYVAAGFSLFYYDPYTSYQDKRYFLRNLGTEGQNSSTSYYPFNGAMTFGGGFKWDINYEYSFNIEWLYRLTFTDYLDDVSGTYAEKSQILSNNGEVAVALSDRSTTTPQIGQAGRLRGDNTRNDKYSMFHIGVVKYIGFIDCPNVSKEKAAVW